MAEMHVRFIPFEGASHTAVQQEHIIDVVYYAVAYNVYGKHPKQVNPSDISLFPHRAEPGARSGTSVEVRVELASDDWLESKKLYNELAQRIFDVLAGSVEIGPPPFVWVTGGPFTGFASGPRTTD